MEAKIRRQKLMQSARQGVVQAAARAVIERAGVEKVSMREIAREAGYTPGALYSFFPSKQALLTALLEESLAGLGNTVSQIRPAKTAPDLGLAARGDAWLDHFLRNPRDWELLVYFLNAPAQRNLPVEVASKVHAMLRASLEPLARSLQDLGLPAARMDAELEAILALGSGLLLAQDSAKLQPPEQSPPALFAAYLKKLSNSLVAASNSGGTAGSPSEGGSESHRSAAAKAASQAGLFG